MRSLSTGGKGQKGPMSHKALLPGDVARWPLSRHRSLVSPPASRTPAPLAPGRGSAPRNQSSPTWLGAVPAVPASSEGGRQGARRSVRTVPGAARRVLTLQSPGQLQSNYGSPQVPGRCLHIPGLNQRTRSRRCPGVGRGIRWEFAW